MTLSKADRERVVRECLEALHPGIDPEIDDVCHMVWDEQENPGQGAFAFFRPGEFSRYQRALSDPFPGPPDKPRVFFAGEHLGVLHAWIQSAMLTAWAAVYGVIRA
jgi:monoamine oxidase